MITRQPAHKLIPIFVVCFLFYLPACMEQTRADPDTKKEATVKVHVALSTAKGKRPGWKTTIKKKCSDTTRYFISLPVFIITKPDSKSYVTFSDSGGGSIPDTISFELKTDCSPDKDDDDDNK